jgi:hypothetical protein
MTPIHSDLSRNNSQGRTAVPIIAKNQIKCRSLGTAKRENSSIGDNQTAMQKLSETASTRKNSHAPVLIEAGVNPTDIYRQAIKRTFADLYGVAPDTVDVTWTSDGEAIIVECAGKTFTHQILGQDNDNSPQFVSDDEDPVIVNLTDDERHQLERVI